MLAYTLVPSQLSTYIASLYGMLTASISTQKWETPSFRVTKGIFQGDTLSPILFLLCFSPITAYAEKISSTGFQMIHTLPHSSNLPPIGSYIYVKWMEEKSDEPCGWYLAQTEGYAADGRASINYMNGSTEMIDLNQVEWAFTRKSSKKYLPVNATVPHFPLKKVREEAKQPKTIKLSPRSILAYADDTTILSASPSAHQQALTQVNSKCLDLGLEIRPDKCVSFVFDGKKANKKKVFTIHQGSTRNISSAPTKFLGKTIGANPTITKTHAGKRITEKLYSTLHNIDQCPIRGEYKVWIYKCYVVPSLLSNLTVDAITTTAIKKLQTKATSYLKRWLCLPKCTTLAAVFHPEVCNLPYLPHAQEKAKLRLLAQVHMTHDQSLQEFEALISDPSFTSQECIPNRCVEIVSSSTSAPTPSYAEAIQLLHTLKSNLGRQQTAHWNNHLESLAVQSKFLDITALEQESRVWSRIMFGLPAGQLSFIIRAGVDTLPTPANLHRWKIQSDPSCTNCGNRPCTVNHVLNHCSTALNQGRYTWRHDSVLSHLVKILKSHLPSDNIIYADLPGYRASDTPLAQFHSRLLLQPLAQTSWLSKGLMSNCWN